MAGAAVVTRFLFPASPVPGPVSIAHSSEMESLDRNAVPSWWVPAASYCMRVAIHRARPAEAESARVRSGPDDARALLIAGGTPPLDLDAPWLWLACCCSDKSRDEGP